MQISANLFIMTLKLILGFLYKSLKVIQMENLILSIR